MRSNNHSKDRGHQRANLRTQNAWSEMNAEWLATWVCTELKEIASFWKTTDMFYGGRGVMDRKYFRVVVGEWKDGGRQESHNTATTCASVHSWVGNPKRFGWEGNIFWKLWAPIWISGKDKFETFLVKIWRTDRQALDHCISMRFTLQNFVLGTSETSSKNYKKGFTLGSNLHFWEGQVQALENCISMRSLTFFKEIWTWNFKNQLQKPSRKGSKPWKSMISADSEMQGANQECRARFFHFFFEILASNVDTWEGQVWDFFGDDSKHWSTIAFDVHFHPMHSTF